MLATSQIDIPNRYKILSYQLKFYLCYTLYHYVDIFYYRLTFYHLLLVDYILYDF